MNTRYLAPLAFAAALALTAFAAQADDASTLSAMDKAGCMACHTKDKKLVGPSFKDISAKYKGQADAPAKLAAEALQYMEKFRINGLLALDERGRVVGAFNLHDLFRARVL